MNRSLDPEKIAFFLCLLALALPVAAVYAFMPRTAEPIAAVVIEEPIVEPVESIGHPVRLRIPKLGIDVALGSVGLTAKGALDAPKGPTEAAWYHLGPRPGEAGSAIIDGHSGWKNGIHAMFDDLDKLVKGDRIFVEDEFGAVLVFEVRETRMYGGGDQTIGVFHSDDGLSHLNLITCEGRWNKETKTYSQRLVVLTDRIYKQII
jgi:LPXTG-site transpeptidase (sortase) family protein